MRISDWSSDVCSSDLHTAFALQAQDDCTFLIRENFGFNHVDTKFTSHGLSCRSIVAGQHDDADAFLSQRRQRFSGCCLDRICNCQNSCDAAIDRREDRSGAVRPHAICLRGRSEEHTSELQSLMRSSYAVFCLKKKNNSTSRLPEQS